MFSELYELMVSVDSLNTCKEETGRFLMYFVSLPLTNFGLPSFRHCMEYFSFRNMFQYDGISELP